MMAYSGDRDNTVAGAAAGIGARVLVTGGAGYIGSHTCKALHLAGYVPVVLDSLVAGHREFVRWGPLVGADIRDTGEVVAAITNGKLDFGPWEQIFYGEYDGMREKRVLVKIIGE